MSMAWQLVGAFEVLGLMEVEGESLGGGGQVPA